MHSGRSIGQMIKIHGLVIVDVSVLNYITLSALMREGLLSASASTNRITLLVACRLQKYRGMQLIRDELRQVIFK